MKYFVDMYQNSSMERSWPKHMEGLLAEIMWVVPQPRIFFAPNYGGPLYIKIRNHTIGLAMYANEWANHHEGMKCPFNHK